MSQKISLSKAEWAIIIITASLFIARIWCGLAGWHECARILLPILSVMVLVTIAILTPVIHRMNAETKEKSKPFIRVYAETGIIAICPDRDYEDWCKLGRDRPAGPANTAFFTDIPEKKQILGDRWVGSVADAHALERGCHQEATLLFIPQTPTEVKQFSILTLDDIWQLIHYQEDQDDFL
jgi:hypothetical protein